MRTAKVFFQKKKRTLLLSLSLILVIIAGSFYAGMALSPPTRQSIAGSLTVPCTFDNFQDTGKFVAKDCKTGAVDYVESSAAQLAVDENQSNIGRFWEAGVWNFCVSGGACFGNGGLTNNNVANITDWGIYGSTVFYCNTVSCVDYTTGSQTASDSIYHAQNITLHDVVLDGGRISDSVCLSSATTLNLYVYHVAMQNCYNLASGGLRITNWNANQKLNRNIFLRDVSTFNVKIGLTGTQNGYLRDSVLTGMPPANTVNYLVDFSKGDFPPSAANNLGQFCFCNNVISGWTKNGIFSGFQAVSNDTISGNTIVGAPGFITTTDFGAANYFNGLDVKDNWYSESTGGINFNYGNFITIINNHFTVDSTPAGGSTGISVNPDASSLANQFGQPNHVTIQQNTIRKWGGIGMVLNFTNGLVQDNQIYDVNQANGNANSNAGLLVEKGLRNVLVTGNDVISDVNSGAGQSRPVNYVGAAVNDSMVDNLFFYQAFGGAQASGVLFSVTAAVSFQVYDNSGENPIGKLTNFIVAGGIGICGTGTSVVSATTYHVCGNGIIWSCSGGTVSAIVEADQSGNQIFSVANCAALPATDVYTPLGYSITFTHTGAPSLTVFAT